MALGLALTVAGDYGARLDKGLAALSDATRRGVGAASTKLQADLRSQVQAAGLGIALANAWRFNLYPAAGTKTLHPAGLVFSKSAVLHDVFVQGATITAAGGRFLAIPTAEAKGLGFATTNTGRKGGTAPGGQLRHASQVAVAIAKLGDKNIRVVDLKNGRKLMLYVPPGKGHRKGEGAVPLFILVPQVRLRSRIDLAGARGRAQANLTAELKSALG